MLARPLLLRPRLHEQSDHRPRSPTQCRQTGRLPRPPKQELRQSPSQCPLTLWIQQTHILLKTTPTTTLTYSCPTRFSLSSAVRFARSPPSSTRLSPYTVDTPSAPSTSFVPTPPPTPPRRSFPPCLPVTQQNPLLAVCAAPYRRAPDEPRQSPKHSRRFTQTRASTSTPQPQRISHRCWTRL